MITIKALSPTDIRDFQKLIKLYEDVFDMQHFTVPAADHLQRVLVNPGFRAIVARDRDQLIGGLTIYTLEQYYSTRPLAYIFDLAVATAYQRQGVGRQLMEFTIAYYREQGYEEIFVQADRIDEHAISFYRSILPSQEEDVIHFTFEFD